MTELEWRRKFGERLGRYLEENNMTQTELADLICVSRTMISNYINGVKGPSPKAVINISNVFGCSVYDLIDFGEEIE